VPAQPPPVTQHKGAAPPREPALVRSRWLPNSAAVVEGLQWNSTRSKAAQCGHLGAGVGVGRLQRRRLHRAFAEHVAVHLAPRPTPARGPVRRATTPASLAPDGGIAAHRPARLAPIRAHGTSSVETWMKRRMLYCLEHSSSVCVPSTLVYAVASTTKWPSIFCETYERVRLNQH